MIDRIINRKRNDDHRRDSQKQSKKKNNLEQKKLKTFALFTSTKLNFFRSNFNLAHEKNVCQIKKNTLYKEIFIFYKRVINIRM